MYNEYNKIYNIKTRTDEILSDFLNSIAKRDILFISFLINGATFSGYIDSMEIQQTDSHRNISVHFTDDDISKRNNKKKRYDIMGAVFIWNTNIPVVIEVFEI